MVDFNPKQLIESIRPESLRVHAPTSVVFLCGGAIDASLPSPAVLRDAFHRAATAGGVTYQIVLAEVAKPLTDDAGYRDLLRFESDIAQVVGLILLFVESAGSLAELGAFAALDTVAPSLLAVLDDFYYSQVSFIRDGPVRFLEKEYGDEWVHVLDRADVGIAADGSIAALNMPNFAGSLLPVVQERLNAKPEWAKFNSSNNGHVILLMVGLCREFGALTQTELREFSSNLGVEGIRFDNFIYCAELLGWIKKVRKGNHIFYVFTAVDSVVDFTFKDDANIKEKVRWRSEIRSYWKAKDRPRFNAISDAAAKVVAP